MTNLGDFFCDSCFAHFHNGFKEPDFFENIFIREKYLTYNSTIVCLEKYFKQKNTAEYFLYIVE